MTLGCARVAVGRERIAWHDGQAVEILDADNRPGTPAQILSPVVDPYFSTGDPGRGAGPGLFITQEIVRRHDGCLAIASRPPTRSQANRAVTPAG